MSKHQLFTRVLSAILAAVMVAALVPMGSFAAPVADISANYEIGTSTETSGSQKIWVRTGYNDVTPDHWFYEGLQKWRKSGILAGDDNGNARLTDVITAAEIYALFVRYIYSETYAGTEVDGAIMGDYTLDGHAAWMDAYTVVNARLASTIEALDAGAELQLPKSQDTIIDRKQAFMLYAVAELSKCADPVWYLNQFSDTHLGYYARSNAPIATYDQSIIWILSSGRTPTEAFIPSHPLTMGKTTP